MIKEFLNRTIKKRISLIILIMFVIFSVEMEFYNQ